MYDVAISECKQQWCLTKVMIESANKFSTKHVFEQKRRTFSEMQPCVATADDESMTWRTLATAQLGVERWHRPSAKEEEGPVYEAGGFE